MKRIIFDFDGTIANTLPLAVGILNKLSENFGFEKIHEDEVAKLRSLTIGDMRQYLKLSWLELPMFLLKLRSELFNQYYLLKPVFGMADTLASLRGEQVELGVITSNDQKVVGKFLDTHFPNYFSFVHCGSSLFGKHKLIEQEIEPRGWDKGDVWYVGDEVRDIEAAKKAGVKCVAVTWGFQSSELLQKYQPDFVVDSPGELLGVLGEGV